MMESIGVASSDSQTHRPSLLARLQQVHTDIGQTTARLQRMHTTMGQAAEDESICLIRSAHLCFLFKLDGVIRLQMYFWTALDVRMVLALFVSAYFSYFSLFEWFCTF